MHTDEQRAVPHQEMPEDRDAVNTAVPFGIAIHMPRHQRFNAVTRMETYKPRRDEKLRVSNELRNSEAGDNLAIPRIRSAQNFEVVLGKLAQSECR